MHSKEKIMNEQQKFEKRKQRTKIILITISVLFMIVMLVLPLFSVITNSLSEGFKFYVSSISTEYVKSALFVTILATLVAVTINTFFGIMAAFLLTKFSFKGKQVLATLIDIPFSISPVIVGLAFLMTFGRLGWTYPAIRAINTFFGTNIRIAFAIPGVILATIFVTFPFVSREIIPILNSQGKDEEEAAALMGASGFTIFRKITLPQMKWGLIYGIILCSARALGEFGAVNALSKTRGETFTLPLEIDALYMSGTTSSITAAFAVSSVLVLIAVVVLILRNIAWYRSQDKQQGKDGR
jgi:sulfate transport system permease protein